MARTAQAAGFARVIGFDMGGTSTSVALCRRIRRQYETQVAGVRMRAPMLSIHTVAGRWAIGPVFRRQPLPRRSRLGRGDPGPACYRVAAPTVTDANVMLGGSSPRTSHRCSGLTATSH